MIEAQDVIPNDRSRIPELFVKVQVGNQILKMVEVTGMLDSIDGGGGGGVKEFFWHVHTHLMERGRSVL